MSKSAFPNGYTPPRNLTNVKPESMQSPTLAPPAPPVKVVPNPLDAEPLKLPTGAASAEAYAYKKNEAARRRALKRQ